MTICFGRTERDRMVCVPGFNNWLKLNAEALNTRAAWMRGEAALSIVGRGGVGVEGWWFDPEFRS